MALVGLFLIAHARPFVAVTLRQGLLGQLFDSVHGFAGTESFVADNVDGCRRVLVVTVDGARRQNLAQVDHAAQRNHFAQAVLNVKAADVVNALAVRPVGLDDYLVYLGSEVDVVDVGRSQIPAESGINVAGGYLHRFRFGAVNVDKDVRRGRVIGRERIRNVRRPV